MTPPKDYGSDVYGQVEATWRTAPPPQALINEALAVECPDCNVNVFIEETARDGYFRIVTAHDDTCPWLARQESGT